MACAKAIVHDNNKTKKILKIVDGDHLNGVQLFGSEPNTMKKAAVICQDMGFDYVDINMGCTIRKVVLKKAGIYLMSDYKKAFEIVSAIKESIDIPLTCKIRLGPNKDNINSIDFSKGLCDSGVSAITIHGRTGEKKFGMEVDYESIADIVKEIKIPIIANGGIFNCNDAKKVLDITKAFAVMPGRGLIGNPWLVEEICSFFTNRSFQSPNLDFRKDVCLKHLKYLCEFYGKRCGIIKMRRILPEYFQGCMNLKYLKNDTKKLFDSEDIYRNLGRIIEYENGFLYQLS
jgi:tRNA-dihydrouridine synthase B